MKIKGRPTGSWSNKPPSLPTLSEAAELALEYMTEGDPPALANWKAADEYNLKTSEVAEETGRYANVIRQRKEWFRVRRKKK
jgi:hypothetical protein